VFLRRHAPPPRAARLKSRHAGSGTTRRDQNSGSGAGAELLLLPGIGGMGMGGDFGDESLPPAPREGVLAGGALSVSLMRKSRALDHKVGELRKEFSEGVDALAEGVDDLHETVTGAGRRLTTAMEETVDDIGETVGAALRAGRQARRKLTRMMPDLVAAQQPRRRRLLRLRVACVARPSGAASHRNGLLYVRAITRPAGRSAVRLTCSAYLLTAALAALLAPCSHTSRPPTRPLHCCSPTRPPASARTPPAGWRTAPPRVAGTRCSPWSCGRTTRRSSWCCATSTSLTS
jgi:hypothetical protein